MPKLKILLTNYMETTEPGGINQTVRELATGLAGRGHSVVVFQGNPSGLAPEEEVDGYEIIRVGSPTSGTLYGLNVRASSYLRRHIDRLGPDIVHVHGHHTLFSAGMIAALKRTQCRAPLVYSPHFDIFSHDTLAGRYLWTLYNLALGRLVANAADVVVAASAFEAKNITKELGVPSEKIKVVPHGVTKINRERPAKAWRGLRLLYAGYLLRLKGVQYVLATLAYLNHQRGSAARLTIVGRGPYEAQLRRQARDLHLGDSVAWRGFIPYAELLTEIETSDMALLISKSEGFGIIVAEALALGTPVIVARTTALNEFLSEPGCYGVNYPPTPQELGNAILDVWRHGPGVGPLSTRIREWGEVVADYTHIYEQVSSRYVYGKA